MDRGSPAWCEERDAATTWADRMLVTAESEAKQLVQLLARFTNADVPLTAPFVEEFVQDSRPRGPQWRSCKPGANINCSNREDSNAVIGCDCPYNRDQPDI